jgi:hypothetical protein
MRSLIQGVIFFAAAGSFTTGHSGELVYKCANHYSQQPCPGGVLIDVGDPRSDDEKQQAERRIRQETKTAETLEKTRLLKEKKRPNPYNLPLDTGLEGQDTGSQEVASSPHIRPATKPDWFKAQSPTEVKKAGKAKP